MCVSSYVWRCRKDSITSRMARESINYCMYEYAKDFKHLMVEQRDANRLNHSSLFFPIIYLPKFYVSVYIFKWNSHFASFFVCLPSLSAHFPGCLGAVVHHCLFCWQSLQDKLRAPAFPTVFGSGNLCDTNCWRCGRVFWRSVTALSYFTFSFQHPVWLLAETKIGSQLAELLCLLYCSSNFTETLVLFDIA